ncbi:MAG: alpha/beta fold hydrolase [Cyclobacteriaceae bacterium]
MRSLTIPFAWIISGVAVAQNVMTPETLWQLGRVGGVGITSDNTSVVYRVSTPVVSQNTSISKYYAMPAAGGAPREIKSPGELVRDHSLSPDGQYKVLVKEVKIQKVFGKDFYPQLDKSEVQIYESLTYRHWDEWEDGAYSHLIVRNMATGEETDIMKDEPFDCPQKPFGGDEDFVWSPDSKFLLYVTKKSAGTTYAKSTNTDIYQYDVSTKKTINLTQGMMGYDTQPSYSAKGVLGWLSMKRDGYESDKNDIVVKTSSDSKNLTATWDGTVNSFRWSLDGTKIFFNAPIDGTVQLFEVSADGGSVIQITKGDFDITGMVGQVGDHMIVARTDMNHATELYSVDLKSGDLKQITYVNDATYQQIKLSKVERRYMTTTDNQKMLTWIIYPPDFDPNKKYPTLLYCQGGPQSALSQFYSYRWNFQLMAANGYIVVAPNRRGMPGHGVKWNEDISKDHGGQVMKDYLVAIDEFSKEPFVDKSKLGCVGASYGGYSVFYLAGIHEKRFKTFISHDGIFDLKSMYGTTEELFFVNWDLGGPYWETSNAAAMKSYAQFDPSNLVAKWDTPILIYQGGKDYRVPIGQGLEAFQAAQLRGIKSKLVYLPNENHWVLSAQNALVWQKEFFGWLKETLK